MTKAKDKDREEAILFLRERLPPGSTLHCIVRKVSRSGMARDISFLRIDAEGEVFNVSSYVARALGWRRVDSVGHIAVRVQGCGMDMCFHTVNCLSYALHGHNGPGGEESFKRAHAGERAGYTIKVSDL